MANKIYTSIKGLPSKKFPNECANLTSKLDSYIRSFILKTGLEELDIEIKVALTSISSNESQNNSHPKAESLNESKNNSDEEPLLNVRAQKYKAEEPLYSFEQLILPHAVRDDLLNAADAVLIDKFIFDKWNLQKIEPFPRTVINLWGSPGTGKTLAAHAIANRLQMQILCASYAQIESMYHGVGPQNLEALFYAAQRDRSVLFIDEADSLLSKRLTDVTTGSEQAINSMRSQLLICIQQFQGIVIFATNLIKNYDDAFKTRVYSIHFPLPDTECRKEIWRTQLYLPGNLPLEDNIDLNELSKFEVCGRDIKEAVIKAARISALREMRIKRSMESAIITANDLINAIKLVKDSQNNIPI
ncbi:putative AAA family ATPase [Nostoc carneum NIES-2107]|nr:putative AAA family ATPase [Nostoc carneum NIES-2107]